MKIEIVQEGETYALRGLSLRQLGLLRWIVGFAADSARLDSSLEEDASAIWTAIAEAEATKETTRRIAYGIDRSSSPTLGGLFQYAAEDS